MHAEDFFTKPLDLARLERRIAGLLHPETSLVNGAEPARG
jgi:DNA-binding response OmpR family regulator